MFLTFTGTADAYANRLNVADGNETAMFNVYGEVTLEPLQMAVVVQVAIDYNSGTSDGFAGFATLCPNVGGPESPTVCLTNSTCGLTEPTAMPTAASNISGGSDESGYSRVAWNLNLIGGGYGLAILAIAGSYYYRKSNAAGSYSYRKSNAAGGDLSDTGLSHMNPLL